MIAKLQFTTELKDRMFHMFNPSLKIKKRKKEEKNRKIKHTIHIKKNGKLTSTAQGAESFALRKKGNSVAVFVLLRRSTFLLTPDPDPVLFFIRKFYWVGCIFERLRVYSNLVSKGTNK